MNTIEENVRIIPLIMPTAQSAGGSTSSAVTDISEYDSILITVLCGVIESGKKLTVTVSESDSESMTDSETTETLVLDGDGTTASNIRSISIHVNAKRKRFIKLTAANSCSTTGTTIAVTAAARAKHYPIG